MKRIKISNIIVTILSLSTILLINLPVDLSAQTEDTTPPELVEFDFTPKSVDISSGPQDVTFTMRITDDITGFSTGTIFFQSPSGQHNVTAHIGSRISGNALDGIYQAVMVVPQFIENGVYHLDHIELYDGLYNYGHPDEQELIAMGFPTELAVTSTSADITPPELIEFDFDPITVDISSGPQNVTFTMRITDDITGFSTGTIFFQSPSGQHNVTAHIGSRISGNALDGIYQAVMVVPQFIENGVYHLDHIELYDGLYNYGHPDEQELIAMGFPTELEVTSTSDTDGDGIPNDEDACPSSDLSGTVIIDGCDSGVDNVLFDDGCTISDLIYQCAEDAKNHGQFNSAVSHILNDLKKDGTISGEEKEEIQTCAEGADIP